MKRLIIFGIFLFSGYKEKCDWHQWTLIKEKKKYFSYEIGTAVVYKPTKA